MCAFPRFSSSWYVKHFASINVNRTSNPHTKQYVLLFYKEHQGKERTSLSPIHLTKPPLPNPLAVHSSFKDLSSIEKAGLDIIVIKKGDEEVN